MNYSPAVVTAAGFFCVSLCRAVYRHQKKYFKIFLIFFEKTIDKTGNMVYNTIVVREMNKNKKLQDE